MNSRTAMNLAFTVIVAFVVAQVAWWFVFQNRYTQQVTRETLAGWELDATVAADLLSSGWGGVPQLLERFPWLTFSAAGGFTVAPAALSEFQTTQAGYRRMFMLEGLTFVAVIISALVFVSSRLRAERELKERQQNFLSAVTHEFKTPVSTLRLLIETALYRELPAGKLRSYLLDMERELGRLEQSSDRVLASARLEEASEAPVLVAEELNSVMQGISGKARSGLETRGATLQVTYSPGRLPVSLDRQAFELVINNLLDNAVKYSPGPHRPVRIELSQDGYVAQVRVCDEGVGIPEGEAERIFERFYRPGSEMTRTTQGVGLGLHLVRSTMEAMNGWVRYEPNAAGRGSCFVVLLPLRQALTVEERFEQDLPVVTVRPGAEA